MNLALNKPNIIPVEIINVMISISIHKKFFKKCKMLKYHIITLSILLQKCISKKSRYLFKKKNYNLVVSKLLIKKILTLGIYVHIKKGGQGINV
jgi:hypothetical protein